MDDASLLQEELHWDSSLEQRRYGRAPRLPPPGVNAIRAVGLVITVALWVPTAIVGSRLVRGMDGKVASVLALIVFGLEMFFAAGVSRRVWVGIGATARTVLRPLGLLGTWPMILAAVFLCLGAITVIAAPFAPRRAPLPTQGRNWHFVALAGPEQYGVTYDRAVQICQSAGERVPSRDDLASFDPPFQGGGMVWLARRADTNDLVVAVRDCEHGKCRVSAGGIGAASGHEPVASVLCYRP